MAILNRLALPAGLCALGCGAALTAVGLTELANGAPSTAFTAADLSPLLVLAGGVILMTRQPAR